MIMNIIIFFLLVAVVVGSLVLSVIGEGSPVALESVSPEHDSHVIHSTGYETVDVTLLGMITHMHDSTPAWLTHRDLTPAEHAGINGVSPVTIATALAHATDGSFIYAAGASADTNAWNLHGYLGDLTALSLGYITCLANNIEPTIHANYEFSQFRTLMRAALLNTPLSDVLTNTSLATLIADLDWYVSGSLDKIAEHREWTRRWIYALGLMWRSEFPKMNERFETMTDAQITKLIDLFLAGAFSSLWYFFIMAAVQSDRAAFSLGYLDKGLLSGKITDEMKTTVSDRWAELVRRNRPAITVPYNHTASTVPFLEVAAINGQTLEDSLHDYNTEFFVPDFSLKLARQMFGIGRYDAHGEKTDFAILLDRCWGVDTNAVGEDTIAHISAIAAVTAGTAWELGRNTALAILELRTMTGFRNLWLRALTNRRHWTYDEVSKWAEKLWTPMSMIKSMNGIVENDAYKAIRSTVFFTAYAHPLVSSRFADPNDMVSTNDLAQDRYAAVNESTMADRAPLASPWIYPFVFQSNHCNPMYSIHFPNLNDNELTAWIRYGMLLGRNQNSEYGMQESTMMKIFAKRFHLVDVISHKDEAVVGLMSSDAEMIRFSSLAIPAARYDANEPAYSEAEKHTCTCFIRTPVFVQSTSAARPTAKGEHPCYMHNLGRNPELPRRLLEKAMLPPSSGSRAPQVTEELPDVTPNATVSDTEDV